MAKNNIAIVDTDIHERVQYKDILEYLDEPFKHYISNCHWMQEKHMPYTQPATAGVDRADAILPDGRPAGTDLAYMQKQLLDDIGHEFGILTSALDPSPSSMAVVQALLRILFYRINENPDNLLEWQKILSIPVKRTKKKTINYLTLDGIKLLLKIPNQRTVAGRRDLALLTLMYDTGARVQEIIDLTPSMVRFDKPYTIKLIGKGNKARIVPLMEPTMKILKQYMEEQDLLTNSSNLYPLFFNKRREKLTRAGVNYILTKYKSLAQKEDSTLIPEVFSCHCLRHSKAMHLLQAGVNLVYIRDILGHCSVQVTEIYAKTDSKQKREAIEKAYTEVSPNEEPIWEKNENLLTWLKSFK